MNKTEWRREIKERGKGWGAADFVRAEFALDRHVRSLLAGAAGQLALAYVPMAREAGVRRPWNEMRWGLPRVDGVELRWHPVKNFLGVWDGRHLQAGAYGLREPLGGLPELRVEAAQWIFVPFFAVDGEGVRLGRGGGFYDRMLARVDARTTRVVGLGYSWQLVSEDLPREAHDFVLREVLTERGLISR